MTDDEQMKQKIEVAMTEICTKVGVGTLRKQAIFVRNFARYEIEKNKSKV